MADTREVVVLGGVADLSEVAGLSEVADMRVAIHVGHSLTEKYRGACVLTGGVCVNEGTCIVFLILCALYEVTWGFFLRSCMTLDMGLI